MGLRNQLYRTRAKWAYKQFRQSWRAREQAARAEALGPKNETPRVVSQGRCPTFSEWLRAVERLGDRQRAEQAAKVAEADQKLQEEFADPGSLEWE